MRYLRGSLRHYIYFPLASLIVFTLLILACGDDAYPYADSRAGGNS